jgi:hypothetical protein
MAQRPGTLATPSFQVYLARPLRAPYRRFCLRNGLEAERGAEVIDGAVDLEERGFDVA